MTFDPFGDFAVRGYLRNLANEKILDIVRRLEHKSFTTGIDAAFARLATIKRLAYPDILETHRILFDAIYPWAGQDRLETAPDLAVSKGPVLFARPEDIRRAVDFALDHGQDKTFMAEKPARSWAISPTPIRSWMATGGPSWSRMACWRNALDFSIDWASTGKTDYLSALTKELDSPGTGYLDTYLKPFVREALPDSHLAETIAQAPGLDGGADQNEVLGKTTDPALQARYEQQKLKRKGN